MIPDAEILLVVAQASEALQVDITIKINDKKILDGIFTTAGVPTDKIRTISSAVDKLDKLPLDGVKQEMEQKGRPEPIADQISQFVRRRGSLSEVMSLPKLDEILVVYDDIKQRIQDMSLLLSYLDAYEISDKVSFDLSLARGLDYYTGVIFEFVTPLANCQGEEEGASGRQYCCGWTV
jgi:histidyl-tRNA synthetase